MSDKKSIRTKIIAVIPVVTGIICAAAFLWNAFFDLCYEYRRSLIGCLLLAVVYIALGIVIRKFCIKIERTLICSDSERGHFFVAYSVNDPCIFCHVRHHIQTCRIR